MNPQSPASDTLDLGIEGITGATRIGAGGFGIVYRAHQETFGRTVAVKVLRAPALDEDGRRRFEAECKAVGSLSGHPHIVAVHASGVTTSGQPFLVMEYLPGGTLAERLQADGPLPPAEVAELGVKLSGALVAAHEAGVLHRDLKPENVLISAYGEPQLVDFGVARVQGGTATRSGLITGSLAHAAPEVLSGLRATEASDVYSLASTLYALLDGNAPFVRVGEETYHPLLARILTDEAPDLRPRGVPEPLWAALTAALEKDPDVRTPSAAALGEALQAAQEAAGAQPTPMAPPRTGDAPGVSGPPPDPGTVSLYGVVARRPAPVSPPPPERQAGKWQRAWLERRLAIVAGSGALALVVAVGALMLGRSDATSPTTPDPAPSSTTPDPAPSPTSVPEPTTTTPPPASAADSPNVPGGQPIKPAQAHAGDIDRLPDSGNPDPANTDPPTPPTPPTPAAPAQPVTEPPVAGQWRPLPPGLENHCMHTQQAGPNLWYQICWSGATPMMVVTVSGITGKSPNHQLTVPRIWTVVNGVHSRGTSCPIKTVTIGQHFACIDETGPSAPGANVESNGRLLHDDVESTLFTRRL